MMDSISQHDLDVVAVRDCMATLAKLNTAVIDLLYSIDQGRTAEWFDDRWYVDAGVVGELRAFVVRDDDHVREAVESGLEIADLAETISRLLDILKAKGENDGSAVRF